MTLIKRHGKYTLVYPHDGRRRWWSTGESDRDEAKKKARAFLKGIEDAGFEEIVSKLARRQKKVSFEELIAWYDAAPIDVKPRTKKHNIWSIRQLLRECGVDIKDPTDALTPTRVATWLKARDAVPQSANSIYRQARSVCSTAHLLDQSNPPPAVPPGFSVPMLKAPKKYYQAPTDPTLIPRIDAASRDWPPRERLAWLMALHFGLRKRTILEAQMDWISGDLFILPGKATKNGRPHYVSIPADVKAYLLAHGGPGLIIQGKHNTDREGVFRSIGRKMKSLGWDRRLKLHEARKFAINEAVKQLGIHAGSWWGQHSSVKVTEQFYADPARVCEVKVLGLAGSRTGC